MGFPEVISEIYKIVGDARAWGASPYHVLSNSLKFLKRQGSLPSLPKSPHAGRTLPFLNKAFLLFIVSSCEKCLGVTHGFDSPGLHSVTVREWRVVGRGVKDDTGDIMLTPQGESITLKSKVWVRASS